MEDRELLEKVCAELGLSKFDTKKYIEKRMIFLYDEKDKDYCLDQVVGEGFETKEEAEEWWNGLERVTIDGIDLRVEFGQ